MTTRVRDPSACLCSRVWLLAGICSVPGELQLQHGRISFTADGTGTASQRQLLQLGRHAWSADFVARLDAGQRATLFRQPLSDTRIVFPWHFFSGGMVLSTRHATYRFAFGQPEPAVDPRDNLKAAARMRRVGKQWIAALS